MNEVGERIGVSGIGVVCPLGETAGEVGNALRARRRQDGEIRLFPAGSLRIRTVSELSELPPLPPEFSGRLDHLSRCDHLAVCAAARAWRDAGLEWPTAADPRTAVVGGAGAGGVLFSEDSFAPALTHGAPLRHLGGLGSQMPGAATAWVAQLLQASGPRRTFATACSSSLHAVARGVALLARGDADRVIAGGSEALSMVTLAGFGALRAVDPEFCRPFHRERGGLTLGEGAVYFVLERESDAAARGVSLSAVIRGAAASCDAHHMTQPDPEGKGARLAMERALRVAALSPSEIALVEAHGTGTPHNDLSESRGIESIFGTASPSITAVKSNVGHTLGAAGAFGLLSAIETLRAGLAPPIAGTLQEDLDPALPALDYVTGTPRPIASDACALVNSFAFGGNNAALVLQGVVA